MRLLLLPAYYSPENTADFHLDEARNKAFVDAGIDLLIYTPIPTRGISDETRNKYKKIKFESLEHGHLVVNRFPLPKEGKGNIMRALRYMLGSLIQFYKGLTCPDIDAIFIVSTPPIQGAMAALIKKIRKVPLVYNLQDIFPDSLVSTGIATKNGLFWKLGRIIEDFTYRNSDKIIVISEDFKRNIVSKGVPEEKIEIIYNWVDEKAVVNIERKNNILFKRYNLDPNKFYITYCGNIGLTQNMDMLLDIAQDLLNEKNIHFVLVGEGAYKKNVESIIQKRSLINVSLLPFQPYDEISHVFSLGDVGLVISKPGVGENSVPSKTWSIMSAERAVIANFDENELKTIIEKNECGIFTKSGDEESFKSAILNLYQDRELCYKMGQCGREFILKNLTKDVGTSKCVDVINSFRIC